MYDDLSHEGDENKNKKEKEKEDEDEVEDEDEKESNAEASEKNIDKVSLASDQRKSVELSTRHLFLQTGHFVVVEIPSVHCRGEVHSIACLPRWMSRLSIRKSAVSRPDHDEKT